VLSITSFALYGFPESHSASFALLVYASAYLKAHYPAAFYTALLNNQPMGFYHPATLVKDAQRRGVRFAPVDVQHSDWPCTVQADGAVRLGLRYVAGLRAQVGQKIAAPSSVEGQLAAGSGKGAAGSRHPTGVGRGFRSHAVARQGEGWSPAELCCPKCRCDDPSMLELVTDTRGASGFCNNCAHDWALKAVRFRSIEDLVARTGINREELSVLAEIGALSAFGHTRREALWQVERAVRPTGELFEEATLVGRSPEDDGGSDEGRLSAEAQRAKAEGASEEACPLPAMSAIERVVADYEGTGLTIGPHPMAMRRAEMSLRGALRASDLPHQRHGRRVRVAGAVITRQRPGTAKGFVFLTLEDETGIANIIIRPDLFAEQRLTVINEPFLLVEGMLQNQDGVTSVRAERMTGVGGARLEIEARDFY
jgi:error-prone DNA polymerase